MDRHVRWFRREIAVGVAQRLALETVVAGALALIIALLVGAEPLAAIVIAALAIPIFAVVRVALACMSNPMTSVYLMRWPHPSGDVHAVSQNNVGSPTDTALKAFQFTARGALDEWGGATTNVYTRGSNQIIVTTIDDDDLVVLSKIDDERLVITTKQLIPPHEQLIVNCQITNDVRAVLASHVELVKGLTLSDHQVVSVGVDELIELLAIEWDAWDQIGPIIGPFVSIGQRRQPSLLQAMVPPIEILRRTGTPEPRIKAKRHAGTMSIATERSELATPVPTHQPAKVQPMVEAVHQTPAIAVVEQLPTSQPIAAPEQPPEVVQDTVQEVPVSKIPAPEVVPERPPEIATEVLTPPPLPKAPPVEFFTSEPPSTERAAS